MPMRISSRQAFILWQKLLTRRCGTIFIQMNSTFVQHAQTNVLVINKQQLPNSTFFL